MIISEKMTAVNHIFGNGEKIFPDRHLPGLPGMTSCSAGPKQSSKIGDFSAESGKEKTLLIPCHAVSCGGLQTV